MLLDSNEIILVVISNGREAIGREKGDNELQTTPEFRAHVAKKLGTMLDRYCCARLETLVLWVTHTDVFVCQTQEIRHLFSFTPVLSTSFQYSVT